MKKNIYFLIVLFITVLTLILFFQNNFFIESIDNKIRDYMFIIRGKINPTNKVVIVDIDEKSLQELGQWPWSRDKLATIIENLTKKGALIIGFDIFFPEKDEKSPAFLAKTFNLKFNLFDTDKIFAQAIANTPTILSFMFNLENNFTKNNLPNIPAVFIETPHNKEFLISPKGYLGNIDILQQSAYSAGFVNMIPDSDGVVRSVPLLMKYDDNIYTSLAFELFRIIYGINEIKINYSNVGIDKIYVGFDIPVDRYGKFFINYRGGNKTFKYISASDVFFNRLNNEVKNKIVLIGTSSAGLYDMRNTPFSTNMPGVEVHANLIDNLIKKDFLYRPDFIDGVEIVLIFFVSILVGLNLYYFRPLISINIIFLLFLLCIISDYLLFVKFGIIINFSYILTILFIESILLLSVNYFFEHKYSLKIKNKFAKKISSDVMEILLKYDESSLFEPKEEEVSIFFSDIRSFTTLSETLNDPKKVIEILNLYMTPMVDIILKHEGTIDKFIGDAIMAYWNAPNKVINHQDKAVMSAIYQIEKLKEVNKILKEKFNITIDIGIGINSGIVTMGEMGSVGRSDFTIIGDNVNIASRLEGLNKYYKTHIIISEYTFNKLKGEYDIRELDLVKVKGKKGAIKIYEVKGFNKKYYSSYEFALMLYRKGMFKEALNIFEKLYNENKDYLYKIYIDRCNFFIKSPPLNWNGVWEFTKK